MSHRKNAAIMKRLVVGCAVLCAVAAGGRPVRGAEPMLAGEPLDQVLLRVKQEVGLYQNESATWHATLPMLFQTLHVKPECGSGDINFELKRITMEFTATLDRTNKTNLGLQVPFGPGGGSIGPGISSSIETKDTERLTYTYYVPAEMPSDPHFKDVIRDSAVILPTLTALRNSLVLATTQRPCMMDTPKDKDDTFTFTVELTRDTNPNIGFNFAVLSAGASTDRQRAGGNTITVTFHPTSTGGKPR